MLDLVLRGGTVIDGTGSPSFPADIGVRGERIASIGKNLSAAREIDVSGLVVAPGFIDTHAHSEFTILADPRAEGKLLQGITTEINGNCGMSAAPMLGDVKAQREQDLREYDIPERWESLDEYFDILEARRPAVNFATLAGHGNIRASVTGYSDRVPEENEMRRMEALLAGAIEAGALGLSTGLIYPPGIYSLPEEIERLALHGAGRREGFIYTSHMRSEGAKLIESVRETLQVGRASGARVHISHIKASDRPNWHKADECVSLMEEARDEGVSVSCDRYPYTASSTDLDAVLPAWVYEGGADEELGRLMDKKTRERIVSELSLDPETAAAIVVSQVMNEESRWMEGLSLEDIAGRLGLSLADAIIEVLVRERLRVGAVFHLMTEENMRKFLSLPYCMVGSDSSARSFDGPTARGRPHPRGFGSFPRFIGLWTGWGGGLEEAVRKVTGLPAVTFSIQGRGGLSEGAFADICVFDPAALSDRAGYESPFMAPSGIEYVIVNGGLSVEKGRITGMRSGRAIRS